MNASLPEHCVVLASNNSGKLAEFSRILASAHIRMQPQSDWNVPACEEPHPTFVENALAKARHASAYTGMAALADDSGLCVPALDNAPGVYSARYAALAGGEHSDAANNQYLINQLAKHTNRLATYVAVLVYVRDANDPLPLIAHGFWEGEIIDKPLGSYGFGYDPHFWLPDQQQTVAQLAPDQKNRLSHRAQALQCLIAQLKRTRLKEQP